MVRSQALCACLLLVVSPAVGLAPATAQEDSDYEGPEPADSTQSMSAGANDDLGQSVERGNAARRPQSDATSSGHSGGAYGGVVPGAPNKLRKPAPAAKGPPTITWPGFQMRPDGSSRVFIQSTKAIEPKVLPAAAGKFELQLPGARVAEKTNRLPLDTRFFNTPVTKVSVSAARSGAVVQLEMRAPVTPQVNTEQGPAGYYFTYIELPKGEYLSQGANTSSNAPPPSAKPATKVIGAAAASGSASSGAQAHGKSGRADASMNAGLKLGR